MNRHVTAWKAVLAGVFALSVFWAGDVRAEGDWQVVNAKDPPCARVGHGMTTLPDGRILLFGGEDDAQNIYNDLFAYDSEEWTPVTALNTPPAARRNQCVWYHDGRMYIHGGVAKNHEVLEDLWAFDIAKKEWSELQTGGTKPAPRYGHAATPLADGSVVLTGGMDQDDNSLKDAWKLNTDKTYTSLGNAPVALADHAAQRAGDVIYLFGEPDKVITYDTKTSQWTELGGGPPLSGAATSALGENGKGQKVVYIFGGVDKNGAESDVVYEYNTSTGFLSQRRERMPFPQKRAASATLSSSNLDAVIFGGMSNSLYINKTIKFTKKGHIGAPISWGSGKIAALFADYGSGNGIWSHDGSGWQRVTDWTPAKVQPWKDNGRLAGIFSNYGSGNGIYSYDDSVWTRLTDWVPAAMAPLGTNDLAAVFTDYGTAGNGIWKYSGGTSSWTRISDWVPDTISSSGDYLTASFTDYASDGNGVWKYQDGAWSRISDWTPQEPKP